MRHMEKEGETLQKSRSAAAELCSGVETTQLRWESTPEAEAQHEKLGRIRTQAVCRSRMTTWT